VIGRAKPRPLLRKLKNGRSTYFQLSKTRRSMALFDNSTQDSGAFNFGMDETAKAYMLETARWSKFLAVVGFVVVAIVGLLGIFTAFFINSYSSRFGAGMQGAVTIVYILVAGLYFFPTYSLYKFSALVKPAILMADQERFNGALRHMRNAFRFIGILTLITLVLYALVFIIGIFSGGFNHYFG
jgi:hypothetical protein